MPTPKIGSYVKISPLSPTGDPFYPGHALYRAEGTIEDYVWPDGETGREFAQVLLTRPRNSRGLLVHVNPDRLERARRR